jgi:predicted RNA binding protein YcfA (HicA-like mRNA interferase family)
MFSEPELLKPLRVLGYERIRQDGSHIRLTTQLDGEFHVTVPIIIRSRLEPLIVS